MLPCFCNFVLPPALVLLSIMHFATTKPTMCRFLLAKNNSYQSPPHNPDFLVCPFFNGVVHMRREGVSQNTQKGHFLRSQVIWGFSKVAKYLQSEWVSVFFSRDDPHKMAVVRTQEREKMSQKGTPFFVDTKRRF